jgi:hypothetical protein
VKYSAGQIARALEAAAWLTVSSVAIRLLPSRLLARAIRRDVSDADPTVLPIEHLALARALAAAARRLPWTPTCLDCAVAGRLMLASRGVPAEVVIGATLDHGEFKAHAWLRTAHGTIYGGLEAHRHHVMGAIG